MPFHNSIHLPFFNGPSTSSHARPSEKRFSTRTALFNVMLCAVALLLSGCGGGGGGSSRNSPSPDPTPAPTEPPVVQPPAGITIPIVCVGDSITAGVGLDNDDKYPSILEDKLGKGYQVKNFGASGTTAAKNYKQSYVSTATFRNAVAFKPQIVVIMLGTNDSFNKFNTQYTSDFLAGYKEIIAAFKGANPKAKVYVCMSPPLYVTTSGHNEKLEESVFPLVRQVARETQSTIIDMYTPLQSTAYFQNKSAHFNVTGSKACASVVYRALAKDLNAAG